MAPPTAAHAPIASITRPPRVLIIDNYDSYTNNLLLLWPSEADLDRVVIVRNDELPWLTLRDRVLPSIDAVLISPGPGSPTHGRADLGVVQDLLVAYHDKPAGAARPLPPVLGVCLGHQAIGAAFGARIQSVARGWHGQVSPVHHQSPLATGKRSPNLLSGIPNPFNVVRYHSLAVTDLPASLVTLATTQPQELGGLETKPIIMALRHRCLPLYGVQFHPESVCSDGGKTLLSNFFALTHRYWHQQGHPFATSSPLPEAIRAYSRWSLNRTTIPRPLALPIPSQLTVYVHRCPLKIPIDRSLDLFQTLFGEALASFWLDSARAHPTGSSFSYMGDLTSPGSITVRYDAHRRCVQVLKPGTTTLNMVESCQLRAGASFWTWLDGLCSQVTTDNVQWWDETQAQSLDCGFQGGMVGIMGYDVHSETLGQPHGIAYVPPRVGFQGSSVPDATFALADRCVALAHDHQAVYLLTLVSHASNGANHSTTSSIESSVDPSSVNCLERWHLGMTRTDAKAWTQATASQIDAWHTRGPCKVMGDRLVTLRSSIDAPSTRPMLFTTPPARYVEAVHRAQEFIRQGESYELCLTTPNLARLQLPIQGPQRALALYARLRHANPAPYAAYFYWGDTNLVIASTSPERFLAVKLTSGTTECADQDDGLTAMRPTTCRWAEMKPIKGTARRPTYQGCRCLPMPASESCTACYQAFVCHDQQVAHALLTDLKERAENLMIVDLVRHDLVHHCRPSTVHVPHLMAIESYQTVHQMVTTVCGQLLPSASPVQVLQACFPPGSMTGAPKTRSVQLLIQLESHTLVPQLEQGSSHATVSAGNTANVARRTYGRRGLYSGCLGYVSTHGAMDMSVVIRTAIVGDYGTTVHVGAGGAITILSDPEAEYQEMRTKFAAAWDALGPLCL
ncbi:para-aminobenzoate synthase, (PABA) [Dimargaris xerosporica]|nr:para-aminobenzoate synthase, (PABA) [Dimargaris xerosporica]